MNFLKGYRTYLVGAVIFVLGGLEALGYHVPPEVYTLLAGAGLFTLRAAVK